MFADQVVTCLERQLHITAQRSLVESGIATLRPVALVQRPAQVEAFTIEQDAVTLDLHLAQTRIATDPILAIRAAQPYQHRIEVRIERRPTLWLFNQQGDNQAPLPRGREDLLSLSCDLQSQGCLCQMRAIERDQRLESREISSWTQLHLLDIGRGARL